MGREGIRGGDRIRALVGMIPRSARVADIGTDHGLLPRILLGEGRGRFCVATETTAAAVARLQAGLEEHPLPGRLEIRAGDGLDPLRRSDRLDVLVLAGMGAGTQVRILSSPRFEDFRGCRLVLQPQGDPAVIRRWLAGAGYRIADERLQRVRGFYHLTLAAEPGRPHDPDGFPGLSASDLAACGPVLARSGDPVVRQFWEFQRDRLRRLLQSGRCAAGTGRVERELQQAERILEALPPAGL